jgi:hypothetical protein
MTHGFRTAVLLAALVLAAAGCGSGQSNSTTSRSSTGSPHSSANPAASTVGAGPLSAEAQAAATGDIPDTQVFLTLQNRRAGYTIKYPEGWTQRGTGADLTLSDKNNIAHIVVASGGAPSTASVSSELSRLETARRILTFAVPVAIHITQGPAIKSTYTSVSAPNPVTGKSVVLIVDRYEFGHRGSRVTVDLGTPKGVDNVDAYRLMINSFAWR